MGYLFPEFPGNNEYDMDLGWLIKAYKKIIDELKSMGQDVEELENAVKELQKVQAEQGKLIDDIVAGRYFDQYVKQLAAWIDANLQTLVARIVKYVMFGLSADGHFVAYIPPSWDFIRFDTIMTQGSELWGHLVLRW